VIVLFANVDMQKACGLGTWGVRWVYFEVWRDAKGF